VRRLPALIAAGALALSVGACSAQRAPDVSFDPGKPLYSEAPQVGGPGTATPDNCADAPTTERWAVHHYVCGGPDDSTLAPPPKAAKTPKAKKAKATKAAAAPSAPKAPKAHHPRKKAIKA
jgi:hypothetical protein